jgi:nicotinate-nucleotide adenylyltransferase
VVLFGTSANPPTGEGGHAGLVRWAATLPSVPGAGGRPVDEVWVLPVHVHAFESKRGLAPFEHRLAMARLAFEHLPGLEGRVRVLDLERALAESAPGGARPGTIDVVRAIRAAHPDVDPVLLLGGDTFRDLEAGLWKESEALLASTPVLVVPRRGQAEDVRAAEGAPRLDEVSSSEARSTTDERVLARALDPAVLGYIRRHGLYAFARGGDLNRDRG